ncbi:MAG: peptidoglycan bridge formation glycyltransferase FemA/FemB family protein [Patescibacteria group bacterium]|nr:peptidoglycan bridge formation glycyltransferase FemA/FemB family protein [Patescibacteria group bacterium]MBU2214300.1 peptidoglycan bridge formation glycyltransferase FemA/FemB family protein [Patescibacteria group bacterium]MBU2250318.1 peptidoglycan bridge formation glycyltransferase FemA/FemB family protein [Patescibacteria group bacterium]
MRIITLINKQQLNNFIDSQEMSQFLLSWEWGKFQEKTGKKIIRLGVESEVGELFAMATLIKKTLVMGKNYFFCPRGPAIVKSEKLEVKSVMEFLFNEIKKIAKDERAIFLRFEPQFKIQNLKFKIQKTIDIEPSKTLVLNLKKTEENLLKEMHQKTRYNIRLAEKKGVEFIIADINRFEDFWRLASQTSERDNFCLHDKNYYRQMIETDGVKLFFIKYKEKFIATGIFSFFGDTVTYLHGASANFDRNVMAPFFLHWQCIKLAKRQGYNYYDFNGIDEKKWPGVTRFKKGFGGFELNFSGTFDMIFKNNWYNVYRIVRKIRRMF